MGPGTSDYILGLIRRPTRYLVTTLLSALAEVCAVLFWFPMYLNGPSEYALSTTVCRASVLKYNTVHYHEDLFHLNCLVPGTIRCESG